MNDELINTWLITAKENAYNLLKRRHSFLDDESDETIDEYNHKLNTSLKKLERLELEGHGFGISNLVSQDVPQCIKHALILLTISAVSETIKFECNTIGQLVEICAGDDVINALVLINALGEDYFGEHIEFERAEKLAMCKNVKLKTEALNKVLPSLKIGNILL